MKTKFDWITMAISGASGGALLGSMFGFAGSVAGALLGGVFGGIGGYILYHNRSLEGPAKNSSPSDLH